jgi:3-deoxy-D-manno-octulosonate 8-phosphate phosphatase (KDO 8-P phosphatase)
MPMTTGPNQSASASQPPLAVLAGVRLLLLDCDGVLTTGGVTWTEDGIEQKTFNIRDGLGIKLWQRAGGQVGIVTGRSSRVVAWRARELGIDFVRQGVGDKLAVVAELLAACGLDWEETAYVGDDLPDLPVISRVGLGVAVADACPELCAAARLVTRLPGGHGAVRELVERLLKARGCWEELIASYRGDGIA